MKAIITGATRGLGKAIAEAFSEAGIDLFLIARTENDLITLSQKLHHSNCKVDFLAVDLSKENALETANLKEEKIKECSILVNNLGIYKENQASRTNLEELKEMMAANLYSAIQMCNFCLPTLIKNKPSKIINIGSVMSIKASPIASNYSISKHALKAWNNALREELRSKNIAVCAVYPGAINTSSWDGVDADRSSMIQTEDIAKLILSMVQAGQQSLMEELHISPQNFKA